jgi:hypothetical protein
MGRTIVAHPEATIFVSRPAIVKIFLILLVGDQKYFVSLSIEFVVQLSTRNISSSIGLTSTIFFFDDLALCTCGSYELSG